MSKPTTPPTLREQFLATQAAKPATVSSAEWPAYALAHAGDVEPVLVLEEAARQNWLNESGRMSELAELMHDTEGLADIRDAALLARAIFPADEYRIGCGSHHVYIHRLADAENVARIVPGDQVQKPRELFDADANAPRPFIVDNWMSSDREEVLATSHEEAARIFAEQRPASAAAQLTVLDVNGFASGEPANTRLVNNPNTCALVNVPTFEEEEAAAYAATKQRPVESLTTDDKRQINQFLTECTVLPEHVLSTDQVEHLREHAGSANSYMTLEWLNLLLTDYNRLRNLAATPAPPMFPALDE